MTKRRPKPRYELLLILGPKKYEVRTFGRKKNALRALLFAPLRQYPTLTQFSRDADEAYCRDYFLHSGRLRRTRRWHPSFGRFAD